MLIKYDCIYQNCDNNDDCFNNYNNLKALQDKYNIKVFQAQTNKIYLKYIFIFSIKD